MGLFDWFKKKENKQVSENSTSAVKSTIPKADKKFYQSDDYYTNVVHEGTAFEHR